jgi:hypothetical protein
LVVNVTSTGELILWRIPTIAGLVKVVRLLRLAMIGEDSYGEPCRRTRRQPGVNEVVKALSRLRDAYSHAVESES